MKEFTDWGNFYLIVGSATGALIGLQFIVLTLIASRPLTRGAEANAAFSTPTIVHFGAVLLLSALLQVPWQSTFAVTILWSLVGFCGIFYSIIVARRMQKQKVYQPIFHNWFFHFILPLIAYMMFIISTFFISLYMQEALFVVGTAVLILLLVGIHNAWDGVTYHVFVNQTNQLEEELQKINSLFERKHKVVYFANKR